MDKNYEYGQEDLYGGGSYGGFGFYSSSDYLTQSGTGNTSLSGFGYTDYSEAFEDLRALDDYDLGMDNPYAGRYSQTYDYSQNGYLALDRPLQPVQALSDFDTGMVELSSDGGHAQFAAAHTALALAQRGLETIPPASLMQDMLQLDSITEESQVIPEIDEVMPLVRAKRAKNKKQGRVAAVFGGVWQRVGRMSRGARTTAAVVAGVMALTGILAAFGLFDPSIAYVRATEVYFDGNAVGAVRDEEALQQIVDGIYADLSEEYGIEVLESQMLEMRQARVDSRFISQPEEVGEQIRRSIDAQVYASVIYIDGMAAVALASDDDAQWVLDELQKPYADDATEEGTGFIEDVVIERGEVSYTLLRSRDDAYDLVAYGIDSNVQYDTYVVQEGDTVELIAENQGISTQQLAAANDGISDETLAVGDELVIANSHGLLNVGYKEIIEVTEDIDYDTQYTKDDTLYVGQTRTVQAGEPGQKVLTVEVRYINNEEVSRTVLSETITKEPTVRIVAQGTMKLPILVQGVSSYGFMTPCTGTLTSPFGPRWGRFHYGIDIANPIGTPIRAAMAGTVTVSRYMGDYGNVVYIDHGNGYSTRYAHNSQLLVEVGQTVAQGEVIALMGSTGFSTGSHCHFEIRINGTAVNPANYL
ncbi:MAG: M23 family metallopeptidase [Clostridia bacterium]|nr:M23 family metallopeptidase [Clostridia bacterium]